MACQPCANAQFCPELGHALLVLCDPYAGMAHDGSWFQPAEGRYDALRYGYGRVWWCPMLLIAGGDTDSQLTRLVVRAKERMLALTTLFHTSADDLPLVWDLETGVLRVGSVEIRATSAFVRQDVFRYLATQKATDQADARNWKVLFDGWFWANPEIRIFNRDFAMKDAVNKPLALVWARDVGLPIPKTSIHASKTEAEALLEGGRTVYKPVAGGDVCRELRADDLRKVRKPHLPRPYIFQERLVAPDLRIFRIGERFFAFEIEADALDYRTVGSEAKIKQVTVPLHLLGPLRKLTNKLGLSYSASDFKASASSDALIYLETNSNPMFAAFDIASEGALVDAMLDWLTA